MATIKTLLDHPRAKGKLKKTEVSLFFRISFGRKAPPIDIPGNMKVRPIDWDFDQQEIIPQVSGSVRINLSISKKKNEVLELYLKHEDLPPSKMKSAIKNELDREEEEKYAPAMNFEDVYKMYYNSKEDDVDEKTLKKYRRIPSMLRKYCLYHGIEYDKLSCDDMGLTFFDDFKKYLMTVPKRRDKGNGLMNQTTKLYIADLKQILKWSYKRDLHENSKYDLAVNVKVPARYDNAVLSIEELEQLQNANIANPDLRIVRDAFVFGCYTGQRFEDVANVTRNDIVKKVWHLWQDKGEREDPVFIKIPFVGFLSPAYSILERNDFAFDLGIVDDFNPKVREIGKLARLFRPYTHKRFSGNKEVIRKGPLYEFMSSHMMRRTCSTILAELGASDGVIIKVTGHSNTSTLGRYKNMNYNSVVKALEELKI